MREIFRTKIALRLKHPPFLSVYVTDPPELVRNKGPSEQYVLANRMETKFGSEAKESFIF